jgi:ferric iron reductase protein FhuF
MGIRASGATSLTGAIHGTLVDVEPIDSAALISEISAVGPYFELTGHATGPAWRPLSDLFEANVLRERVAAVRSVLAARIRRPENELDERACASLHFLALASRLLAPALAGIALRGVVLETDQLWWQSTDGGPVPVAWVSPRGHRAATATEAAKLLETGLLGRAVAPLIEAFDTAFGMSHHVLLGNAASALNGAATMLHGADVAFVIDPREVVAALVGAGRLRGTGSYRPTLLSGDTVAFVRHNCCLFYRIPGGSKCGDCVLTHRVGLTSLGHEHTASIIRASSGDSASPC